MNDVPNPPPAMRILRVAARDEPRVESAPTLPNGILPVPSATEPTAERTTNSLRNMEPPMPGASRMDLEGWYHSMRQPNEIGNRDVEPPHLPNGARHRRRRARRTAQGTVNCAGHRLRKTRTTTAVVSLLPS